MDNLTRELRLLADYHGGTDLVERLSNAQREQEAQRKALRTAADRIEVLEMELRKVRETAPVSG